MRQFTVQNDPDNLGFVVTFIEEGRALQAQVWRHSKNLLSFRAALLLTWIAGLLDRFNLGHTIIGKLARTFPIANKEGHDRHFAGGLVLYAAVAVIISAVLALFGKPEAGGFAFHSAKYLTAFAVLYAVIAFAMYVFFLMRAQVNNGTGAAFRRRITMSAADMAIVIESDQDRLRAEAFGRDYRPPVIRMSQVVGLEDHHASAHNPSVNAGGSVSDAGETANHYEVSLFTSEGRRFVLMNDTGGPDTAREIRTRIASLIHRVQQIIPRYQRLYDTKTYTHTAFTDLCTALYDSPPANANHHPHLNVIPESDRL